MKIKQTRQVRLDELLKYVWDNGIVSGEFRSDKSNKVFNDCDRWVLLDCGCVTPDERFTITEEVEITEDTPLQRAMVIKNNLDFYPIKNRKINGLKTTNIKFIYLQNEDGSVGDLIWTKERGLID